jgi:signal peptidase II
MVICLLDQYLKRKIEKKSENELPNYGFVKIRKSHNYGLCLNHLDKHPKLSLKLSALCLIGYLLYFFPRYNLGTYFMLCGGMSNLYDRIKRGYVVDYIQFPKVKYGKDVIYNLADFEIFLGVFLTLVYEIKD